MHLLNNKIMLMITLLKTFIMSDFRIDESFSGVSTVLINNEFCRRLIWYLELLSFSRFLLTLFPSWQCKHHNYLFYFCKNPPQYNGNYFFNFRRRSFSWASSVNWLCGKYNYWLNSLLKVIDEISFFVKMLIHYNS